MAENSINPVSDANSAVQGKRGENRGGGIKIGLIVLATALVTVAVTSWVLTRYVFPSNFEPVELSAREQSVLDEKVARFADWTGLATAQGASGTTPKAEQPEKYSENDEDRIIELSERELNALLANNTELAQTLFIDLSDDLASGKLLIPLDQDFPVMGGKTLKITAGLTLEFANDRPVVILRGISVMGIPLPNAWLGGIKNVDLVSEFGDSGFWKAFAEGVAYVRVEDSQLVISLKE